MVENQGRLRQRSSMPNQRAHPSKATAAMLDARLQRALTLQGEGKVDEVEDLFLAVLKDQLRTGAVLYPLAAIAHARGQFQQALEPINQCVAAMLQFTQAHQTKATIELSIKRAHDYPTGLRRWMPAQHCPIPRAMPKRIHG
jgi:thioredoxin-like negative regulator of GroEL